MKAGRLVVDKLVLWLLPNTLLVPGCILQLHSSPQLRMARSIASGLVVDRTVLLTLRDSESINDPLVSLSLL